jgi:hypothetical protein
MWSKKKEIMGKWKGKAVSVSEGTTSAPSILNLDTRWRCVVNLTTHKTRDRVGPRANLDPDRIQLCFFGSTNP